ncbi:uncharacterized protein Pyn_30341 [Prunus yedoensis var. nudiflora]|uniref:Zinc knuckle CX2CX4HX4C domain-containing protein n=1 Tax=Prunus yedoensis var. nudiflora TaxID=2094558 RepID=A0A314XP14_PRUYE|nr:uncharacterized protein Pyn_30341 [Prunus yedoensis var. nudiflora]
MEKGPWHVHDDVFSIQPWPSNCALAEIHPNKATYWIQAHGIPLGMMTGRNALLIGGRIGTVIGIEDPAINGTRSFLRMRIEIDTTKPLQLGFWLPRGNGGRSWINLRYEGLRRFCFRCGRLGHTNFLGKPCVHTLCPVVVQEELKYGVGLAVRPTRGPSPLFPVKHPRNTIFSLMVTEEVPVKRSDAEGDYDRPEPVPRQSAVSFRPAGVATAKSNDNADHVQLDGGQHAVTGPNEEMGLHPTVSDFYSTTKAIMTPAIPHSLPAIGQGAEAPCVMPTETIIETLNINSFLAPTPTSACVSNDLTYGGEPENILVVVGALPKLAPSFTEPDPTSDTKQTTQKKRGKKKFSLEDVSLPSDTDESEDAFKVPLALPTWKMVALIVAVMAYPSPSSSRIFGSCDFSAGFGLASVDSLIGYWWCGSSLFLVLGVFLLFLPYVLFLF